MITKDRMFVCFSFVSNIVSIIAPPSIKPRGLINQPPPPAYAGNATNSPSVKIAENLKKIDLFM